MIKRIFTLRLISLLLIAYGSLLTLDAQEWVKTFNYGPTTEAYHYGPITEAYEVFEAPDSGYVVLGIANRGDWVLSDFDSTKLYLIKTDIDGNEEWARPTESIAEGAVATMTSDQHLVYVATKAGFETLPDSTVYFNTKLFAEKVNMSGNTVWSITEDDYFFPDTTHSEGMDFFDIIETHDEGLLIVGSFYQTVPPYTYPLYLIRLDKEGNILWKKHNPNQSERQFERPGSIVETPDHGFLLTYGPGIGYITNERRAALVKLDSVGNEQWTKYYTNIPSGRDTLSFYEFISPRHGFHDLHIRADNHIIVCGIGHVWNRFSSNAFQLFVMELDENGVIIQMKFPETGRVADLANRRLIEMEQDEDGGFLIVFGEHFKAYSSNADVLSRVSLLKVDAQLNTQWIKRFGDDYPGFSEQHVGAAVKRTSDDHYIIAGRRYIRRPNFIWPHSEMYLIKTDTLPQAAVLIEGHVKREYLNNDCQADSNMQGLQYSFIQTAGAFTYSAITDTSGYYAIELPDTGLYNVSIIPPNMLWDACQSSQDVQINSLTDTVSADFLINTAISCPSLSVDIDAFLLRQCVDSTYYFLRYCNMGTAIAEDARIELELSPEMQFISTSGPPVSQQANLLTFDLGDVDIGECGDFKVRVFIPCETNLELVHCVEARIYPDTNCLPLDPLWDLSSLLLTGTCEGDSVAFQVSNVGSGNMSQPTNYIVIEDEIMRDENQIQLSSGESRTIKYLASGGTIRMEVEQSPGHPGQSQPSVSIEGCGFGTFSWGTLMLFAQDDGDPTVSIACRRVNAPYDPNDKQGFPLGVGEAHYIKPGTDLEYLIRFQNVGNDTAFTVVILDTLSPHLNALCIEPGASSHPYELGFASENVLKFTFNNIHLPDSTTNEAASHGFVNFRICQDENLPLGTIIYNSAAIYFDYLDPVITNQTYHEVNENFLTTSIHPAFADQGISIKAFPNPFTEQTTFHLENTESLEALNFRLYDVLGQPLMQKQISGQGSFNLQRNQLATGLYFYEISSGGQIIGSGKLLIQ